MASCAACGDDISGAEELDCEDCGESYCRWHYHGHECMSDDADTESPAAVGIGPGVNDSSSDRSLVAQVGYAIAALAGIIGTLYLVSSIDVITGGGNLRDLFSLVIAGSFFSFGTFLMVGAYIREH